MSLNGDKSQELKGKIERYKEMRGEFKKLQNDFLKPLSSVERIEIPNAEGARLGPLDRSYEPTWDINIVNGEVVVKFHGVSQKYFSNGFSARLIKEVKEAVDFVESNREVYNEETLKMMRATY